jgi:hypothetical protein
MHAPVVAAKAKVVFAVNPAQRLRHGDGLRDREARLRLIEPGNRAHLNAGQAVIQRTRIQRSAAWSQNAKLRCNVGGVGEEIGRVDVAPIPVGIEDIGHFVIADCVAGLHRVGARSVLAAQLRENVHVVRRRVGPVVVEVDALAQSLILVPAPAATAKPSPSAPAGLRGVLANAAVIARAGLRGVGLRCRQQVIVIAVNRIASGDIRLGIKLQQRLGRRRNPIGAVGSIRDHVAWEWQTRRRVVDGGQAGG